jgi:1-acyl-sn-glycerol-3-phosphate acyltransferase
MGILRALPRLAGILAMAALLLPVHLLIAEPLFQNKKTIPRLFCKGATRLAGITAVYNGVAPEQKRRVMNIFNHISDLDPVIINCFLDSAFVGKDTVSEWFLIGRLARSVGTIFVKRYAGGKYLPEVHGKIAATLNQGRNVSIFPEGRTTNGKNVNPFKNGGLSLSFNNLSDVKLNQPIVSQLYALKVTHVNGQPVGPQDQNLRDIYACYGDYPNSASNTQEMIDTARHIWRLLKNKSVRIEMTGLPVMDPKDYSDYRAFAAAAENTIRNVVVSP